jgi:hypothetical protein
MIGGRGVWRGGGIGVEFAINKAEIGHQISVAGEQKLMALHKKWRPHLAGYIYTPTSTSIFTTGSAIQAIL